MDSHIQWRVMVFFSRSSSPFGDAIAYRPSVSFVKSLAYYTLHFTLAEWIHIVVLAWLYIGAVMSAATYTREDLYSLRLPRQRVSPSVYSSLYTPGPLRRRQGHLC